MAEIPEIMLKWLGTISDLVGALPVTPANSGAMATMYTTLFQMVQVMLERLPVSAAVKPPPIALKPTEILRAAAATPLPDESRTALPAVARPMDIMARIGEVLPATGVPTGLVRRTAVAAASPAGAEDSDAETTSVAAAPEESHPITNKISLRAHGYKLSNKDATRFAALKKAREAHGTGTVTRRLEMLEHIWAGHKHPRAAEFCQSILTDIAYLRDMDRRAAHHGAE
jgi:hypothetical protein